MYKKLYVVVLLIILINITQPVFAQSGYSDISRLKPLTKELLNRLSYDSGTRHNIRLEITYAPYSWYRKDWLQPSYAYLSYIYIWNSSNGPRIRFMTENPSVLQGCRLGRDAFAANVDLTVPTTDPCYFTWYTQWAERPALDLEDILTDPSVKAIWVQLLRKHGHTSANKKFGRELSVLGLNPITGLPNNQFGGITMKVLDENAPTAAVGKMRPEFLKEHNIHYPEPVPMELRWDTTDYDWLPIITIVIVTCVVVIAAIVRNRLRVYA